MRFDSLYEDGEGNLWIRSEGGVLTRYRGGSFMTCTTAHGLPDNQVRRIGHSADGALLVETAQGVARFQHERFAAVDDERHSFAGQMGYYGESGADRVWYRRETELRCVNEGRLTIYQALPGDVNWLYEDRQNRLWLGVGQPGGLAVLKDDALHLYTVKDGLPPTQVLAFCEDREGTLWLGTSNNGLMRMAPQLITAYSEREGLVGKAFYPILEDRAGNIWIANRGANRFKQGKFTYYPLNNIAPHRQRSYVSVSSLYEDGAGQVWLGAITGLLRFRDERFAYEPSVALMKMPLSICKDRQGAFWFGFNNELLRVKDGVEQRCSTPEPVCRGGATHLRRSAGSFVGGQLRRACRIR